MIVNIKLTNALIVFFLVATFSTYSQNVINVKDWGVFGDGKRDDWQNIQQLIDDISIKGGGTLFFPEGIYLIKDRTLLIWGDNINIIGESSEKVVFLKTGSAGWWGDLLAISGKYRNGKYYGSFGLTRYNNFIIYKNLSVPSNNISIRNITFRSNSVTSKFANNVGVFNSRNVIISNCIFTNSVQTNLAIVNNTLFGYNENIVVDSCVFKNSGAHNVRVISYNHGKFIGNSVIIKNSTFENVLFADTHQPEIKSKKVHIWYRAGIGNDKINLLIVNSTIDRSGIIQGTMNVMNLSIINNDIYSQIVLNSNEKIPHTNVNIERNTFLVNKLVPIEIKGLNEIIVKDNVMTDQSDVLVKKNNKISLQNKY